jgi:phage gp36-like protein
MACVTNADIEQRLGSDTYVQLTDDDGDGTADSGVVNEARIGAEGEVDSYLARRFQLPIDLSAHPDIAGVLASFTLDLIEYRLRSRRPPVPKDAVDRHAQAIEWLKGVADGTIELPSTAGPAASTARGPVATTTGDERVLSREELSDY